MHGGQESTLLTMMVPLLHHACTSSDCVHAEAMNSTRTGGTPYGASHVAGTRGDSRLSEDERELAQLLGRRVAELAAAVRRQALLSGDAGSRHGHRSRTRWVLAMTLLLAACVAAAALRTAAWPGSAALALALLVPLLLPLPGCCADGAAPTPGHALPSHPISFTA